MLQIYLPSRPIQWSCVAMKGPDAADFLHRLTTVHVKALQPGSGAPGFFLTAQGKMKAYFQLWKIAPKGNEDEFFFEFDAGESGKWKTELLSTIDQFHFSEKFTLEEPTLSTVWILGDELPSDLAALPAGHLATHGTLRFFHHGNIDFGKTWISVWGPKAELEAWTGALKASTITFEQTEALRINTARPRIDTELSENTIPLEVGLKDAISDNKGCYPGQEVIERIISLGSPARRLARVDGTGPVPSPGEILQSNEGQDVGQITSAVKSGDGYQALAMIKKIHAKEGLEVHPQSQSNTDGSGRGKLVVITRYA